MSSKTDSAQRTLYDFDMNSQEDGGGDTKKSKKTGAAKPAAKPRAPKKTAVADGIENKLDVCHSDPLNVFEDIEKATEGGKKRLSIERIYQKKTQLEHILLRPDTYIGSVEPVTQGMWIYDTEKEKMMYKEITFVPGLYKIFDEIIVNAADNKQRDKNMTCMKVTIDANKNEISVWNNGKGIPVVEHQVEKMYVPELIFGTLLTSSNYDDSERKVTGGRNGYGAKLCNIFSTKFTVETSCREYKKSFKQTWTENMQKTEKCKLSSTADEDFTRITFTPDLAKFKMEKLDDDIVSLMCRRAYDMAGTTRGVKVYLNGKKLPVSGFKQYVEQYTADRKDDRGEPLKTIYEQVNDRWEVAVTVSEKGFQQVSFVNSIATTKGGRHVDYASEQIVEKVIDKVKSQIKKTGMTIRPFQVKNHMWIFVNCLIENPTFDSQTKENMTLQAKSFGSKCVMTDKFLTQVMKSGIVESVMQWVQFKQQAQLDTQCHSKKHSKLRGVKKLEDANDAGTKKSTQCTLILTEGDSAKAMAVGGLGVVGRDSYGVFPLRGKVLNVREAAHKQIMENAEINSLVKILGLQYKKKYTTPEDMQSLRYGKIMIMTDQDQDGSHIKGLLINFIHFNWPSLLRQNFIEEFITPIVKVSKGQQKLSFFSIPEYEEWKSNTNNWQTWTIKYYKGLGTSEKKEAVEYFSDMQRHRIRFKYTGETDDGAIELAFAKKKVEERKEWLTNFMEDRKTRKVNGLPDIYLYEKDTTHVTYKDFVNKELVLFSNLDNERSIPNLVDGFKPGQRKVIFACFKRNDKKEVKVAQLAGSVAEKSAYHHGEASLMGTIINLAQNYVGSNNINLLMPNGQFGTRLQGGKDAASPRYIFTMLSPVCRALFLPADEACLKHLRDDNKKIEPEWYCPVVPMVLINGADGIGTGFSTNIPCYNPRDIVRNLKHLLDHEDLEPMIPWYKGFRGEIIPLGASRYLISGEIAIIDDQTVEITELPIGTWTQAYKESVLEPYLSGTDKQPAAIQDFKDYTTDTTIKFVVKMTPQQMAAAEAKGLHTFFKLQTPLSSSNMVAFDSVGCLRRFATAEDILKEFFAVRQQLYVKRKQYLEGLLEAEANQLSNKARFILEKIDFTLKLENKKKKDIVEQLVARKFDPDPIKKWKEERQKLEDADTDDEEVAEEDATDGAAADKQTPVDAKLVDYDYLLSMAMIKMSSEEKDKLLKERDEKKTELATLRARTSTDLWREDLENFLNVLEKHEQKEADEASIGGGQGGKKGATAAKGKAKGGPGKGFTLFETLPSANAQRVEPVIDKNLIVRLEKQDKAKTTKGTGSSRGKKKDKGEVSTNGVTDDDLENSSLFDRISKKRPTAVNLKKAKPVADDKGIKRFLGKKRAKSDSEEESSEFELENDGDESDVVEIKNDEENEFNEPPPKKTVETRRKVEVKYNVDQSSDDDVESISFDEDEDEYTPPSKKSKPKKASPAKKTTAKKKTTVSDDGDFTPPSKKSKSQKNGYDEFSPIATKSKPKNNRISESDDD